MKTVSLFSLFLVAGCEVISGAQIPPTLSSGDWQSIRAAHEAARHGFQAGPDGVFTAHNPGQQWALRFDEAGFLARPQSGGWEWGLELRGQAAGGAARIAGNRLTHARYDMSVPAQTTLGLTGPRRLVFSGGKLMVAEVQVTNFSVSGNRVTKVPATDKSFSLSFTQGTGFFKGTFTPDWTSAKLPAFNGVLLGKGANQGGWGYFMSNQSGDLEPESGSLTLGPP